MTKEHEIWENFKAGDKSALSYVYFQNFHSMFQYGIRFKGDPEFIKDCIQDVFLRVKNEFQGSLVSHDTIESSNLEKIEKLAALKNKGIITEEEFSVKKKELLGL